MTSGETLRVTVAVLTYLRPEVLRSTLPAVLGEAGKATAEGFAVEVLVVDNDPDAGARATVAELAAPGLRYVVEPEPGIAAGRNRALDEASGSDVLVFIDDDERPAPGWLPALLSTYLSTGAAGVVGAVVSEFDGELDPWVRAGSFFSRRRLATGTRTDVAATNNLLLDLRQVRAAGIRFDPAFGLSGGEDTLFSRQLAASGGALVWCDEAVVTDRVPAERMTANWVLRRAFSSGNSHIRVDLALAGSRRGRARARLRGLGLSVPRIVAGAARWVAGQLIRSHRHQARGLRTVARGAGMLAGALGHVYQEYGRQH
jgi:glycosyltransferase involved in cell wall biosynthesis